MRKTIIYKKAQAGGTFSNFMSSTESGGQGGGAALTGLAGDIIGQVGNALMTPNADKANTKMDNLYAAGGAKKQDEFTTYAEDSAASVNAYNNKSTNLFAEKGAKVEPKRKRMILYKKAQGGEEVSAAPRKPFSGQMTSETEQRVKDTAAGGYGVTDTYSRTTPGAKVNTVVMKPNAVAMPAQEEPWWNESGEAEEIPNREGKPDSNLRTRRRGILRNVGKSNFRNVNFMDKLISPDKYNTTTRQADKAGYKSGY